MNPKVLLFLMLSLLLGVVACKDSDDDNSIQSIPKIKTMTFYQNEQMRSQQSFEYDLSGRLVKRSYSNNDWTSYSYAADTVMEKHYIAQVHITQEDIILLNSKGLAVSKNHGNSTMQYDSDGYLIQENNLTGERYSFLYEIKNGNRVKGSMIADNNYMTLRVMQTNQFLPNSTNTTGEENMGLGFWGKQDKELVSARVYSQGSPVRLEYEYDSSNRVSKCKVSNGTNIVYTYY